MSDEDEVVYVKRQKTIHYGSLEDSMLEARKQQRRIEDVPATQVTPSSSQIPEYLDLDLEM